MSLINPHLHLRQVQVLCPFVFFVVGKFFVCA